MAFELPDFVHEILDKFAKNGFEIYIVGGSVRDLILGRKNFDWDFTTNATPNQILEIFPRGFYNNKFGTVGISHPSSSKPYEITTFRKEVGYSDHRHPDKVIWGESLREDLSRRDFTINAMALSCKNKRQTLIDYFDGKKDLKAKLIRAVGDPQKRFSEDALRMIRAIRLATELGFIIEEGTLTAIKKNAGLINQIAKERIRDELLKILGSDFSADGFTLLLSSRLLQEIIPELLKGYGMAQAKHHVYDVWMHSLLSLKYCPSRDPVIRFATLLHDIGKPVVARGEGEKRTFYNHEVLGASIARNIAQRLRFSKKQTEKIETLVRWHQFTCDERQTDSAIRRFIRNVGKDNLQDILDLRVGDRLGGGAKETSWRLERFKKRLAQIQEQPFSVTDLKISGYDVMNILGINPGPKVGRILDQLFSEVAEDKAKNDRQYLLKRLREIKKTL